LKDSSIVFPHFLNFISGKVMDNRFNIANDIFNEDPLGSEGEIETFFQKMKRRRVKINI
jgi:hypothetical protein